MAAAELAEQLGRLVQRASVQHGGRPVKWLGDGVMFFFPNPGPGVVAALEMVAGVAEAGLPPAHVGLHAGPVIFQEGDYYGQTVNVASRIAEYARPGEVVVSQEVVDAIGRGGGRLPRDRPGRAQGRGGRHSAVRGAPTRLSRRRAGARGRGRAVQARRPRSESSAAGHVRGRLRRTFGPTPTLMLPRASLTRYPGDPLAATRRGAGRGGRARARVVRRNGRPRVDPRGCGPLRRRRSGPAGPSRPLVLPPAALPREFYGRPTPRQSGRPTPRQSGRPTPRAVPAPSSARGRRTLGRAASGAE